MPQPASNPIEPPKETRIDKAIAVGKAMISEVPFGGTCAELAAQFLRTPYQKRVEEWQQVVGEILHRLQTERGVPLDELQNDDRFVDAVLQATMVAIRNSQKEKREALRNAVMNSALPGAPEESELQMFLQLIDRFTVWHLALLAFFDDPVRWCVAHDRRQLSTSISSSLSQAIETSLPDLKGKEEFYTQVCNDLEAAGLAGCGRNLKTTMSAGGWKESRTTPRGKQFLKFVSEPA